MILHVDYLDDYKFCPSCEEYVPYIQSPAQCYCMKCGRPVRLFSDRDYSRFRRHLRRPGDAGRDEGREPA